MKKTTFLIAAVFNIFGGLLLVFKGDLILEMVQLNYIIYDVTMMTMAALIMLFGLVYLLISRAPAHHVSLINLGIVAKVLFGMLCIILVFNSMANYVLLILGFTDLLFARSFYRQIKLNF